MSWEDAHRYNKALREVEVQLNRTGDGRIAWRPEYAEIFGSPERLLLALRSRWETTLPAQVGDTITVDGGTAGGRRALAAQQPGLARALARAEAVQSGTAAVVAGAA